MNQEPVEFLLPKLLNEKSSAIDNIIGFKKPLRDYQRSAIYKILEIEKTRHVKISPEINKKLYPKNNGVSFLKNNSLYKDLEIESMVITTDACVLSEPYGSGKTIIALGVLLSRPKVQAFYEKMNRLVGYSDHYGRNVASFSYNACHICNKGRMNVNDKLLAKTFPFPSHCIGEHQYNYTSNEVYRKIKTIFPCSMICVGNTVLLQWEEKIKEYTSLTFYTIKDVKTLREFIANFKSIMSTYDIILIRNGMVSGEIYLHDEDPTNAKQIRPILSIVSKFMNRESITCQWGIYDDYDTNICGDNMKEINSLFKLYISATLNLPKHKTKKFSSYRDNLSTHKTAEDHILYESIVSIEETAKDPLLVHFNVKSEENYIKESNNLPIYHIYRCTYKNPSDTYMSLLGAMGTDDAKNIMEALNGDAIQTAALSLGVTAEPDAGSIFQKVLEKEWEKYETACYTLSTLEKVRNFISTLPKEYDAKGTEKSYSLDGLDRIRRKIIKSIRQKNTLYSQHIPYYSDRLHNLLDEMESINLEIKKQVGEIINRVKENIKMGDCPVCCCPFEDIIITKCCNLTICGACLKGSFWVRIGNNNNITGKCANCKKDLNMSKDIVYVTHGMDLKSLAVYNPDEVKPEEPAILLTPQTIAPIDKNPKLQALYEIIYGRTPENCSKLDYNISNLMPGIRDVPCVSKVRKVLLFAGFNETLLLVRDFCNKHKIQTFLLQGTYSQMYNILDQFKNCEVTSVLLVNSNQNCSGMDIQYATDLVFFHKICNTHIEGQVAGRMQRVGRTENFNIYYLLYNNEIALM